MQSYSNIFIVFLLAISSFACVKEEFDPNLLSTSLELNPTVAVPIGYSTLTLGKLLTDSLRPQQLQEDANGFFTLYYEDTVFSYRADELMNFPANVDFADSLTNDLPVTLDLSLLTTPLVYRDTVSVDFSFEQGNGSERLDSVVLDKAQFSFAAQSDYAINGTFRLRFENISKSGLVFEQNLAINDAQTVFDLSGYTFALDSADGESNRITAIYEIVINNSPAQIPAGAEFLDFAFGFSMVDYSAIYGFIGNRALDLEQGRIALSFYDKILDGNFHFEAPVLNVRMKNSLGLPIELFFSDLYANTRDDGRLAISGTGIPSAENPRLINYPDLSEVGQTVRDSFYLTTLNTNLFNVLEQVPRDIIFNVAGQANPPGQPENNFVLDSSRYSVELQAELPIWGWADFLVLQDTMSFSLGDFYNHEVQEITKLTFVLNFTNSFPVSIDAQVYFYDENLQLLDSMFQETRLIEGGIDLNGDGKTDPHENEVLIVEFDRDKVERIKNARYLVNRGRVMTTNAESEESVRFYSDYFLEAHLGVIVEVETNTSEL